jgi:hypothetical protein
MAQDAKPTPVIRKPIVMKWTTLEGLHYFFAGTNVDRLENLEGIISPLKDKEADRLLSLSESSTDSGTVCLVGGSALLLGGLFAVGAGGPDNNQLNNTQTIGLVIAVVGAVGDYVGLFKLAESETAKFAAVQRYNQVIHGDTDVSWNTNHPSTPSDLLTFKF